MLSISTCLTLLVSELLCGWTGCVSPLVSDGEDERDEGSHHHQEHPSELQLSLGGENILPHVWDSLLSSSPAQASDNREQGKELEEGGGTTSALDYCTASSGSLILMITIDSDGRNCKLSVFIWTCHTYNLVRSFRLALLSEPCIVPT